VPTKVISMDEQFHLTLKQCYQQFEQQITELQSPPFQPNLHKQITQFVQQFLRLAKHHPIPLFAQLQLYKSQFTPTFNLGFNTLIYTSLLASRNKFDDSIHQQLLFAAICLHASTHKRQQETGSLPVSYFSMQEYQSLFSLQHRQLLRHICKVSNYLDPNLNTRSNKFRQLDGLQICLFVAVKLAKLTTLGANKTLLSFALALKKVCIDAPSNWYVYLRPLLDYPTLIPPGSCIKDEHDNLVISLAVQEKSHLILSLSAKSEADSVAIRSVDTCKIRQVFPTQKLANLDKLTLYWGEHFEKTTCSNKQIKSPWGKQIGLGTLPSSLIAIQSELNLPIPRVDKIVEILEQEEAFSTQLQNIASANSRLMLPIVTSRHGLLMNGFDRSYQALLQHSLLSRLTQESFPLQKKLLNFTQLFCFIADALAKICGENSSNLASTIGLFSLSYYFISPTIRTCIDWQTGSDEFYKISRLFKIKQTEQASQFPVKLAQAWQQNHQVIKTLQQLLAAEPFQEKAPHTAMDLVKIIGLALVATRKIYFGEEQMCEKTKKFEHLTLLQLAIESNHYHILIEDMALKNQIYCSFTC
jgi:hypothetical protein